MPPSHTPLRWMRPHNNRNAHPQVSKLGGGQFYIPTRTKCRYCLLTSVNTPPLFRESGLPPSQVETCSPLCGRSDIQSLLYEHKIRRAYLSGTLSVIIRVREAGYFSFSNSRKTTSTHWSTASSKVLQVFSTWLL